MPLFKEYFKQTILQYDCCKTMYIADHPEADP